MADTPIVAKANTGTGLDAFASDLIAGTNWPYSKIAFGASGTATAVSASNRLPVDIGTVSVSVGNFPATQPVSGAVSVSNFPATQAVTGTFWQATQPVSGNVGITGSVAVTGALTDAQLRAAAVPISGTVSTGLTQPLTDVQLRAAAVPVSIGAIAASTENPDPTTSALPVVQKPIPIWVASFADVASSLVSPKFTQRRLGTGVTVAQSAGNLVITAGTTTNAEFLARSTTSFNGAIIKRARITLSQRIANNNFALLLADRVGEGLAYTINSATSITVTSVAHGYTAQNVGQFMCVGGITGAAGIPGRYAIASIPSADTINFTVAGWPASGSGTLDLFGWNYYRALYTGTTATNAALDAQRQGWASGDTTATINTTASPGHILHLAVDGRQAYWSDTVAASSVTPSQTTRASRYENLPDGDVELFVYLWSFNGTTAPASSTSITVGFVTVEDTVNNVVYLGGVRPQGQASAVPVTFPTAQAISGTVTANPASSTISIVNSAASTNGTVVKATAGTIYGIAASNTNAATRFLKLHNSTTVTVGTTAVALTIPIPTNTVISLDFGALGMRYGTGICLSITGAAGDTDTTAIGAGEVKVNTSFI